MDQQRKARKRGSATADVEWEDYVTPRPDDARATEVTGAQALRIREAVAWFSTAKAGLDAIRQHGDERRPSRFISEAVDNAMDASLELLDALRPIAGPERPRRQTADDSE